MSFYSYDTAGKIIRNRVTLDCQKAVEQGEIIRVEQNHKDEVNINNIVKRHGADIIAQTNAVMALQYDDLPSNDFQETMNMILKGQQAFDTLDSKTRAEFENNPAKYMDYVHNPENRDAMIERGWLNPPESDPQPIEVVVINSADTPPAE